MSDPRVQNFAKILVEHSTRVAPGDRILVEATTAAEPLVQELFRQILEHGGVPHVALALPGMMPFSQEELYLRYAKEAQLDFVPTFYKLAYDEFEGRIRVHSSSNPRGGSAIDPSKSQRRAKALGGITESQMRRGAEGQVHCGEVSAEHLRILRGFQVRAHPGLINAVIRVAARGAGALRNPAITSSPYRLNEARIFGRIRQRLAQLADGGIDAVIEVYEGVRRPERLAKLFARHYLPVPVEKEGQDLKRAILELHLEPAPAQFAPGQVNLENSECDYPLRFECFPHLRRTDRRSDTPFVAITCML